MSTTTILIKKEFLAMSRDFKLVWLPLVFIFLGITQPVSTYYLPAILEALGGSSGIIIDPSIVAAPGGDILAGTLVGQFDQLGVLIIVIATMGIVQADKANGMLAFILTRPVAVPSYIGGKIIANYLVIALSVTIGYIVSYFYVVYLFTDVPIAHVLTALLLYLVWTLFIVSFTTMISTMLNSAGIIALIAIAFLMVCRLTVDIHPFIDMINPAITSHYATEVLVTGIINSSLWGSLFVTFLWIFITIVVSNYWISKKKFSSE